MTMAVIWTGMVTVSVVCGLATGRGPEVAAAAMEGAAAAVEHAAQNGNALAGKQVGVGAVGTDDVQGAFLLLAEGQIPLGEVIRCFLKGELLIEGAGVLITVAAGFLDHVQDSSF